ncbi:MAG: hypothetical protein IKB74_00140 [Lentisphaeria bacterium]|nr:hypothetical protein [Lentisphaeria bacterium]
MKRFFLVPVLLAAMILSAQQTGTLDTVRKKAEKVRRLSPEDFELGKELLVELRKLAAKRRPVNERPLLMMESLSAAGRMWFTDHNYTDRQLFCARDMWEAGRSEFKTAGHRKTFELMELCGVDLINCFLYGVNPRRYAEDITALKPDLKFVPTVTPQGYNGSLKADLVKMAAELPAKMMLNGKMMVLAYSQVDAEKTGVFLRDMEKMAGIPISLIYSCGTWSGREDPYIFYMRGKGVPATTLLYWYDRLSEVLEFCAGVRYSNCLGEPDGTMSVRYYEEVIMPLFGAVFAQERFNGKKLWAQQITTGYNNYRGYQRRSHDGTGMLRNWLDLCVKYKLDLISGFEWDEYNEDTHFQPTVNKPMAVPRILRFYTLRWKGRKITPLAGDDLTLPDLIVSFRKQMPAGPDFEVELLNVPDSNGALEYKVTLELLDENGKTLLAPVTKHFDRAVLKDHTVKLPAAKYINSMVIIPRLTIDYKGKTRVIQEGLPFAVVRPTTVCDATWYSTPLRNILFPADKAVKFGKAAVDGLAEKRALPLEFNGVFPEELNSLEVVQDGRDTRFAFDRHNEFRQYDETRRNLRLTFYYLNNPHRIDIQGKVEFRNAPSALEYTAPADPGSRYFINPSVKAVESSAAGEKAFTLQSVNYWRKAKLYSLEKTHFDSGVIVISGTRTGGKNKGEAFRWELPLKELISSGLRSQVFPDGLALALEVCSRFDNLPLPLNSKSANFKTVVKSGYPTGAFAIRAVSRAGKVWWSSPCVLKAEESGKKVSIPLFHDKKGVYSLKVDSSRIPVVKYRFSPAYAGNILTTAAGREFYAHAGSYDTVPTGFEGYHCSIYSVPHSFGVRRDPAKPNPAPPQWEKDADGKWILNFSGEGEFIGFPPSLFPQRTGFTVKMEFLPQDISRDQVYFTHENALPAGFRVRTQKGKLIIDFYRRQAENDPLESIQTFDTGLSVQEGIWQKLELSWDMKYVSLRLDGQEKRFKTSGIPRWMAVGGFGGCSDLSPDGRPRYFKGKLKSFEVIHMPDYAE